MASKRWSTATPAAMRISCAPRHSSPTACAKPCANLTTCADTILAPVSLELRHDLPAWVAAGHPTDVERFRLPEPRHFVSALPDESAREIRGLFDVWTTSLKGLTKGVTRIRSDAQVRECKAA